MNSLKVLERELSFSLKWKSLKRYYVYIILCERRCQEMTKPIQIKNLTIGSGIPKICVPLIGTTREKICQERGGC